MRNLIVITAVIAAAFTIAACGKKTPATSPDELMKELAALAEELDAYLSEHDFANADESELATSVAAISEKFSELSTRATGLAGETDDDRYNEVGALAKTGARRAAALAEALAGDPAENPANATMLAAAVAAWAEYDDTIAAGGTRPGSPIGSSPPGRGHHYGWWKNPPWANDPASRGVPGTAGTGEKERERERERDRGGKGTGPEREREREREHAQPGGGKGGGAGKGGGHGRGGGN